MKHLDTFSQKHLFHTNAELFFKRCFFNYIIENAKPFFSPPCNSLIGDCFKKSYFDINLLQQFALINFDPLQTFDL